MHYVLPVWHGAAPLTRSCPPVLLLVGGIVRIAVGCGQAIQVLDLAKPSPTQEGVTDMGLTIRCDWAVEWHTYGWGRLNGV